MALRNEVKEKITQIQTLFQPYIGKSLTVEFDKHSFTGMVLLEVTSQPVTGFKLSPDKRKSLEHKMYSPVLIKLIFKDNDGDPEGNSMVFVDEDTRWSAITNGVRARLQEGSVSFRLEG